MEPDESDDGRNGWVIPLGRAYLDISTRWVYREPGLGIAFPIGGPFYYQLFGVHLHLFVFVVYLDLFKREPKKETQP